MGLQLSPVVASAGSAGADIGGTIDVTNQPMWFTFQYVVL